MATIVTRQTGATAVSRPLTNTELDNNFINLNTAVTAATTGPASATDNALVRFNATTGKLVQNSSVIVDDTGKLTATSLYTAASGTYPVNNFTGRLDSGNFVPLAGTGLRLSTNSILNSASLVVDGYQYNITLPSGELVNSLVANSTGSILNSFIAHAGSTWTINNITGVLNQSSTNTAPNGAVGMAVQTLNDGNIDDGYYAITIPWATTFLANQYSTVYIGTNSYVTFGAGSPGYSNLSYQTPDTPKVMIASGDNNVLAVYTLITGTTPNRILKIRYEGSHGTVNSTNSKLTWEYWIHETLGYDQLIIDEHYDRTSAGRFSISNEGVITKLPITSNTNIQANNFIATNGFQFSNGTVQTTAATNVDGVSNFNDTVASWAIMSTFAGAGNPTDVFFKADGTKMFLLVAGTLNQYTLSVPWDITTAGSLVSINTTWDTASLGLFFSPDGTKLITCGQTAVVNAGLGIAASEDRAYYLTLSTPWDISSTITLVSSLRFGGGIAGIPTNETAPAGITFNDTGTIMYMVGSTGDAIYQYTLTTAYNVSTATYLKQLSMSSIESGLTSIRFNNIGSSSSIAGSRMYIIGTTNDSITEFRLSTPWDIATAVYYDELYVGNYEGLPNGLYIDEMGYTAYIVGTASDLVTRFDTSATGISLATYSGTGKIDLIGETRVKNANLYVDKNVNIDGDITLAGTLTAGGFAGIVSGNYAITLNSTTTAINIGTPQTSGTIIIGGTAGTGAITLGQSTAAQTLNLGTGANTNGITKAINIGTNGLTSSMTNIVIGSAVGGTDTTLNVAGRLAVVQSTGGYNNVSNLAGGTTVTGSGTLFTKTFQVGDTITIGGQTVAISAIASDTSMTTAAITNANTNATYTLTGGTRFVVNGNGNVGIGTTLPVAKLQVGSGSITPASFGIAVQHPYNPSINLLSPAATGVSSAMIFGDDASNSLASIKYTNSSKELAFINQASGGYQLWATGGAERMRLDSSGNLGIGTTSPAAKLDVFGYAQIQNPNGSKIAPVVLPKTPTLEIFGGDANENNPGSIGLITPGLNVTAGQVRGSELYFVSSRSTTAQLAALTYTAITTGDNIGRIMFGGDNGVNLRAAGATIAGIAGSTWSATNAEGYLTFSTTALNATASGERMRLDSSGNLGIGTTSPARKLDVNGPVRIADANVIEWGGTSTALVGSSSTNTMQFFTASSERMRIDSSGNVGIGTVPIIGYGTSIQLKNTGGATSALLAQSISVTDQIVSLSNNALPPAGGYTGTYNYTTSSTASLYELRNNTHTWHVAPSGIAGATTTVTSGQVYIVTVLSTSTLAQWQALFSSLVALPTVGASLVATATGTLAGGATVTQRISFNSAMKLDGTGNLLLGTTAVTSKLTIYTGNNANANEGISLTRGPGPDNVFGMRLKADGTGQYRNAITSKSSTDAEIEVITIDPVTGNVGINTISPNYKLDVSGNVRVANTLTVNGNLITRNLSIFARSFMTMGA